jgi:hypothetical protein
MGTAHGEDPRLVDEEFGALLAQFSSRGSRAHKVAAMFVWICLFFIVAIIVAFVADAKMEHVNPWMLLPAIALPGLLALFFQTVMHFSRRQVLVFSGGLVDLRGKKCAAFRWEKVEAVYQTLVRYRVYILFLPIYERVVQSYKVRSADGSEFLFGEDLGQVEQLFAWICTKTLPPLLSWALELYDTGDDVGFGGIVLNRMGLRPSPAGAFASSDRGAPMHLLAELKVIYVALGEVSWDAMRGMDIWVEDGSFCIGKKAEPRRLFSPRAAPVCYPVDLIPNFHLLLALIERQVPLPLILRASYLPQYQAPSDPEKGNVGDE